MAVHKKLVGQDAVLFRDWINKTGNTVIDLDGQKFIVKPVQNEVQEEVESDPKLKKMLLKSKEDIANGRLYSTEEVIEKIESARFSE